MPGLGPKRSRTISWPSILTGGAARALSPRARRWRSTPATRLRTLCFPSAASERSSARTQSTSPSWALSSRGAASSTSTHPPSGGLEELWNTKASIPTRPRASISLPPAPANVPRRWSRTRRIRTAAGGSSRPKGQSEIRSSGRWPTRSHAPRWPRCSSTAARSDTTAPCPGAAQTRSRGKEPPRAAAPVPLLFVRAPVGVGR
mmetsp:Transcript_3140/g.9491  ORF Transcript_3140/g.9491 Transcript_3140/m.9491 type:complete len:203 (+) Transcript_3140:110-718(+)